MKQRPDEGKTDYNNQQL